MEQGKGKKLKTIQFTIQEIWAASNSKIHKNKKKYNRKDSNNKSPSFIIMFGSPKLFSYIISY